MSNTDLALFIKDFAGLAVAAILVFFSGRLLPKRARWFFWTAGFAIIVYELYLRLNNRRILQELDDEWAQLRKRKTALEENNQTLQQEAKTLADKLAEMEAKAASTFKELDSLNEASVAQREANQAQIKALEAERAALEQRRQKLNALERKFKLNSTLIREIENVTPKAGP